MVGFIAVYGLAELFLLLFAVYLFKAAVPYIIAFIVISILMIFVYIVTEILDCERIGKIICGVVFGAMFLFLILSFLMWHPSSDEDLEAEKNLKSIDPFEYIEVSFSDNEDDRVHIKVDPEIEEMGFTFKVDSDVSRIWEGCSVDIRYDYDSDELKLHGYKTESEKHVRSYVYKLPEP